MSMTSFSVFRQLAAGIVVSLALGTSAPEAAAQGTRDILLPPGTDTAWHGVWLPIKRTISASQITTFEAQAGKKVGAEIYYVGWYANAWADLQRQINVWEPLGIKTMVVWEPALKNHGDPLAAILSGSQDAIINDFAMQAQTYGRPFFLRFAHEMNGNWYPWSGALSGSNPQKYIDAWRYVWTKFQSAGATNAVWVWAPNWNSVPDESWNALQNYYPGDAYVDVVANDLYDQGFKAAWDANEALYAAHRKKPYAIAEWGLWGIDDPAFVERMAAFAETHRRLEFLAYFNSKPGSIWDLASKPKSRAAYRRVIAPLGR